MPISLKCNFSAFRTRGSGKTQSSGDTPNSAPNFTSNEARQTTELNNHVDNALISARLRKIFHTKNPRHAPLSTKKLIRITRNSVNDFENFDLEKQNSLLHYAQKKNEEYLPKKTPHGEELAIPKDHALFSGITIDEPRLRRTGTGKGSWFLSLRLDSLGEGGFGQVNRGLVLNQKSSSDNQQYGLKFEPVAVKEILKVNIAKQEAAKMRELNKLKSDYLIKYIGSQQTTYSGLAIFELARRRKIFSAEQIEKVTEPSSMLVLELAPHGNAKEIANKIRNSTLPESEKLRLLRTMILHIAKGVKAMHDAGWGHCDIKETNVMLGSDGRFKLCDFGVSINTKNGATPALKVRAGTHGYFAPELNDKNQLQQGCNAQSADMYSLGKTIVALYKSIVPSIFTDLPISDPLLMITQDNYLCSPNPSDRPSINYVLSNQFFLQGTYEPSELLNKLASEGIISKSTAFREHLSINSFDYYLGSTGGLKGKIKRFMCKGRME